MKKSTISIVIVVIVIAIIGIWSLSSMGSVSSRNPTTTTSTDTGTNATTTATVPAAVPLFAVATSATGSSYLTVLSNNMTLYSYAKDSSTTSACTGTCATTWLPFTVTSVDQMVPAIGMNGTLATIVRSDGSVQVVYNGKPLYLYSKDVNPGDTKGNGVGKVWSVVKP